MNSNQSRLPCWAIILNAGVILIPVAIGFTIAAIIKWVNPDNVDISNGLVYLQPILIVTYTLVALFILLTIVTNIAFRRRTHINVLWLIFSVQIIGFAVILLAQGLERSITGG